jgi:hypothetical protein
VLANLGYRRLNSWWGCVGTVQAALGQRGWGVVKRRVFEREHDAAKNEVAAGR